MTWCTVLQNFNENTTGLQLLWVAFAGKKTFVLFDMMFERYHGRLKLEILNRRWFLRAFLKFWLRVWRFWMVVPWDNVLFVACTTSNKGGYSFTSYLQCGSVCSGFGRQVMFFLVMQMLMSFLFVHTKGFTHFSIPVHINVFWFDEQILTRGHFFTFPVCF